MKIHADTRPTSEQDTRYNSPTGSVPPAIEPSREDGEHNKQETVLRRCAQLNANGNEVSRPLQSFRFV